MTVDVAEQPQKPRSLDWQGMLRRIPYKSIFGVLAIGWVLLFHFFGNSTQGFVKTTSLFGWLAYCYDNASDDWHGYLIPLVVVGLLWWKRQELADAPKRPWWPAALIVLAGLALHATGFLVQQARISVVGFFFGLWGLVGVVWGAAILRATFFPFFLFVFCLPMTSMGELITFPLRLLATKITWFTSYWVLGIKVQQAGTSLFDPTGRYSYEVAAACSGIQSLSVIFALTSLYAFVFFKRNWKRAAIIAAGFPLAVISNVLRLLLIIIASEAISADAGHYVHESTVISLLPYVIGFAGVFLIGRWLKEDRDEDLLKVAIPVAIPVGVFLFLHWVFGEKTSFGLPTQYGAKTFALALLGAIAASCFVWTNWRADFRGRAAIVGLSVLATIGATAGVLHHLRGSQRLSPPGVKLVAAPSYGIGAAASNLVVVATNSIFLPDRVLNYKSEPLPLTKIELDWLPKDTTFGDRRYISEDGFFIDNRVRLMGTDRTSIHRPEYCLNGQGFQIAAAEQDLIRIERPTPYDLPVTKLKFAGEAKTAAGERVNVSGLLVYWFVSNTEVTAQHQQRMLQMSLDLMRTGVLTRWAYVLCVTMVPPGREDAAYERLKEFIAASVPEYQLTVGKPADEGGIVQAAAREK